MRMKNKFLYFNYFRVSFILSVFGFQFLLAQPLQNRLVNPVLSMRDGATERFMGIYYAIGEGTKGNMYYSKDMFNWSGPVFAAPTNEAIWLNDPKWTQASVYKEM